LQHTIFMQAIIWDNNWFRGNQWFQGLAATLQMKQYEFTNVAPDQADNQPEWGWSREKALRTLQQNTPRLNWLSDNEYNSIRNYCFAVVSTERDARQRVREEPCRKHSSPRRADPGLSCKHYHDQSSSLYLTPPLLENVKKQGGG
jgi:hypothetical protein